MAPWPFAPQAWTAQAAGRDRTRIADQRRSRSPAFYADGAALAISGPESGFFWWRITYRVNGPTLMPPTPRSSAPPAPPDDRPKALVPLALWPVAQTTAAEQWTANLPGSADHLTDMTPELARRIVVEYSQPGELILVPQCGAGPILIEAAAGGRRTIGIESEDRRARLAVANCEHILPGQAWPLVDVVTGDTRRLADLVGEHVGYVDLVIVAPSAGAGTGDSPPSARRSAASSSALDAPTGRPATTNLRDVSVHATAELLTACRQVLRPGGLLVSVTHNTHTGGRLIELASRTVTAAQAAGFDYLQHVVAVRVAVRDGMLAPAPSPSARAASDPAGLAPRRHRVVHHDILVFREPADPALRPTG